MDLKLGIKPKAGNFFSGNRVREGGERETEIGRLIKREKERYREVKTEWGRQKSNKDEDLVKRYDKGNISREKERERGRGGGKERLGPNLEQPQGITFLQRGMERDMGDVG